MATIRMRNKTGMVKVNKNGTSSTFQKTLSGKWKKTGYSGNSRTKTGKEPVKRK